MCKKKLPEDHLPPAAIYVERILLILHPAYIRRVADRFPHIAPA